MIRLVLIGLVVMAVAMVLAAAFSILVRAMVVIAILAFVFSWICWMLKKYRSRV